MATLKEVKTKISAVKKTKQITKAMKMVATSKLRSSQMTMEAFRPYAEKFSEVLGNIAEKTGEESNPLLTPKEEIVNTHIVLLTSDRGLCGGFNTHLIEKAEALYEEKVAQGRKVSFTNFGKKGNTWCRKNNLKVDNTYLNVVGSKISFTTASKSGDELIMKFLFGEYDEVFIIYASYQGMASQLPVVRQILPIPVIETKIAVEKDATDRYLPEHIIEPSPDELLNEMLPRNVYIQIYHALLETSTSEHAARMRAMDNATKACNDMIDSLTLAYNKARQAAITAELMDIVGGAEALRG
jgi:F-type H+-transporting ATPase subunit gamma